MLNATGICRQFGDRHILRELSLKLSGGDRIGLVGASGSGKSLLLRTLSLLEPVDAGRIHWNGSAVVSARASAFRAHVMYVRQHAARFEGTVDDSLQAPFRLAIHREKSFDRRLAIELLEMVGRKESFLSQSHENLSGGESQIVALVCATLLQPNVLLLDEPTSALDPKTMRLAETLIDRWFESDPSTRALVWVTHGIDQAKRNCDQLFRLREGKLALAESEGNPDG